VGQKFIEVHFTLITEFGGTGSQNVTIGTLSNDVLLEIFFFYVDQAKMTEQWHTLVHVCQRWRYLVFARPRRLRLRLLCTEKTPVRKMLDVWPALPIVIWNSGDTMSLVEGADNIIAALEHHDRVQNISLWSIPNFLLARLTSVMQQPFPVLTSLALLPHENEVPILPESFLGSPGSTPRLQTLWLDSIQFPTIQKLYFFAGSLAYLHLYNIPHSGYVSPVAMVNYLSSLTRLESLILGFRSPQSRPDREGRHLPPLTRTVFPALTSLEFRGASEYLEGFISRVDVPLLNEIKIRFFNQLMWHNPQFLQFICLAKQLSSSNYAELIFYKHFAMVRLSQRTGTVDRATLELAISCTPLDWQLSSLTQICDSISPSLKLERLDIREDQHWQPYLQHDTDNAQWLEVLCSFTAATTLYLSKKVGQRVALALQDPFREPVAEVLPVLQNIFLEGLQSSGATHEAIERFVTARRLLGHSVLVHPWEREIQTREVVDALISP
jgi:hypothetical protein